MTKKSQSSSCLCGSVKMTVSTISPKFTVCHCKTCTTWGGGPYFAIQCGVDVKFEGQEKVKVYDSSLRASRGFCLDCGTHLFYQVKKTGEYNMPVGLFAELEGLVMSMQYFSDKRPAYYCFSNETQEMTEADIQAYIRSLA